MMDQERLITYINSLENGDSALVRQIAAEAQADYVPIIRKETASLLKTLVTMKQPKHILNKTLQ